MAYSRVLIAAFLLVLAACSAPPMGSTSESVFSEPADVTNIDPCFRFGLGILSGFDTPNADTAWEPHDWMLLGIKITHGDKTDVWFVRLTTLPNEMDNNGNELPPQFRNFVAPATMGDVKRGEKFRVPVGRVLVKCYNQHCQLLGTSVRLVPQTPPGESLLTTCMKMESEGTLSAEGNSSTRLGPDVSEGFVGLVSMVSPIGGSGALKPMRETAKSEVVRLPSVLGLLVGGLRFNLSAGVRSSAVIDSAWSTDASLTPRRQIDFPLQIGGQTVLNCRTIVGPADPPYNLTGGILQFEASHPQHPQNQMTVRVLAAKRMHRS